MNKQMKAIFGGVSATVAALITAMTSLAAAGKVPSWPMLIAIGATILYAGLQTYGAAWGATNSPDNSPAPVEIPPIPTPADRV